MKMPFCHRRLGRLNNNFGLQLGVVCESIRSVLVRFSCYLSVPKCHALLNILSIV